VYKNDPGYGGQQNEANLVELASALAIVDFLGLPDNTLSAANGKVIPNYREFGIAKDVSQPTFFDLGKDTHKQLSKPLTQFALFRKYMEENFYAKEWKWNTQEPKINKGFLDSDFYNFGLKRFFEDFYDWLKELSENDRGFAPLDLKHNSKLDLFVKGKPISAMFGDAVSYNDYNGNLNKFAEGTFDSPARKFLDIFYKTTEKIVTNKKQYGLGE
jgi:hypothetical protein